MKTKILRNIFPNSGVIFASARLLAAAITSILLLGILAPNAFSVEPTITTFDAPGAGIGPGQGTQPFAINPAGLITGFYFDAGDAIHGSCALPTAPSAQLMFLALGQAPARAQPLSASLLQARSR